jgi:hypothetical protein
LSLGRNNPLIIATLLAALWAAIYAPALGHGFIKDDYRWIAAAEVHSPADVLHVFASNVGFYRPLVTISFAIDRAVWGLDPRGYASTNLLLLVTDAALLFVLGTRLGLPAPAALFAVAVWALNFHGINMALLWISGRTALLLMLFSLAATLSWLRGHGLTAGLFALAAVLCKEEAVVLPLLLTAVAIVRRPRIGVGTALARCWPLWVAAGLYALLREHSGAFGVSDAPAYYRLVAAPRAVLKNVAEYLDRGATVAAVAVAALWVAARRPGAFTDEERGIVRFGACWFAAMYAITVLVPVRSSLYAVAPSGGSAIVAGAFAARASRVAPRHFARVSLALLAIAAMLVPVYRARNHGFVEPADLARQSLRTLQDAAASNPGVRAMVLVDDPAATVRLEDAFGALLPDAVHLFVDSRVDAVSDEATAPRGSRGPGMLTFELRGGRLIQVLPARSVD